MKKRIKIFIIAFLFIITWALHSKSMAAANCKSVPEENVKYVNATLTNINIEEYNAWQRGISTDEYYSLSLEERHQIDDKSMLFDSTDAKCYGGGGSGNGGYVDAVEKEAFGKPFSAKLVLPPLSTLILRCDRESPDGKKA